MFAPILPRPTIASCIMNSLREAFVEYRVEDDETSVVLHHTMHQYIFMSHEIAGGEEMPLEDDADNVRAEACRAGNADLCIFVDECLGCGDAQLGGGEG